MALAWHPLGAYAAAGADASRTLFAEYDGRKCFGSYYENCGRSSSSRFDRNRVPRSLGFSSSGTSHLFMKSVFHQIHVSVSSRNCTSRVFRGTIAALDENVNPQKKQQPSIDDLLPEFDELTKDEIQNYLSLELQSGLDMDTYRHYEIMFIIHEMNADEVKPIIDKVTGFILENKGFIYRINDWGLRRLAYKIKKAERGNYVLMNIEVGSSVINDLNTMFEKDERVIRHMVISQKEAISEDMEPPEEWRPSSAYGEGGEEEEEEADEEYDDDEEVEEEDEGGQKNGELILERQK